MSQARHKLFKDSAVEKESRASSETKPVFRVSMALPSELKCGKHEEMTTLTKERAEVLITEEALCHKDTFETLSAAQNIVDKWDKREPRFFIIKMWKSTSQQTINAEDILEAYQSKPDLIHIKSMQLHRAPNEQEMNIIEMKCNVPIYNNFNPKAQRLLSPMDTGLRDMISYPYPKIPKKAKEHEVNSPDDSKQTVSAAKTNRFS